jgi:Zn-dependent protease/predicted transcriptional regulator
MGLAGTIGLFLSIVFHELAHSLVARRYGLPIRGITLFIFGGVAEMDQDPPSARTEFLMALAGPGASALLGLTFYGLNVLGRDAGWSRPVNGVMRHLVSTNVSLAAFNLLPAFPLDGGRVLRAVLWRWRRDIQRATHIAAWTGSLFGNLLVGAGTLVLLLGNFVGSVWLIVVGLYLRNASRVSYRRLSIQQALRGERVQRFMQAEPITLPPTMSVEELVENYVYKYHYKMFPVVEGTTLVGCVSTSVMREVPRAKWGQRTLGELARPCTVDDTVSESVDAMYALSKMSRTGNSRLMVVDGDRLVGVITLKDMLNFLSLKLDLRSGLPRI